MVMMMCVCDGVCVSDDGDGDDGVMCECEEIYVGMCLFLCVDEE